MHIGEATKYSILERPANETYVKLMQHKRPCSLSGFSRRTVVSSPHALAPPLCARAAARAQPSAVGLHRQRLRHRPLRALARRRASRAEGSARHPPHPLEEGSAAVLGLRAYATGRSQSPGVRPSYRLPRVQSSA